MKKILLCSLALLGACAPTSTAISELNIAVSPAAQPASAAISVCLPRDESVKITIDEISSDAVDLGAVDFYVRLGVPEVKPVFSAQLATEKIELVLHSTLSINTLNKAQIIDLLSGRVQNWNELGGDDLAIQLWAGPESDEARQGVQHSVLLGSPISGAANFAAGPQQVLDAVAADPGAAGILPAVWIDDSVKAIDLQLELPLLAVASKEPSIEAQAVLACLQSAVGQDALDDLYQPLP